MTSSPRPLRLLAVIFVCFTFVRRIFCYAAALCARPFRTRGERFSPGQGQPVQSEALLPMVNQVWMAHKDWMDAQKIFMEAVEPELVDQAIYQLMAAESKYGYLVKKAQRMPSAS